MYISSKVFVWHWSKRSVRIESAGKKRLFIGKSRAVIGRNKANERALLAHNLQAGREFFLSVDDVLHFWRFFTDEKLPKYEHLNLGNNWFSNKFSISWDVLCDDVLTNIKVQLTASTEHSVADRSISVRWFSVAKNVHKHYISNVKNVETKHINVMIDLTA